MLHTVQGEPELGLAFKEVNVHDIFYQTWEIQIGASAARVFVYLTKTHRFVSELQPQAFEPVICYKLSYWMFKVGDGRTWYFVMIS